jgi:hypothetical protein
LLRHDDAEREVAYDREFRLSPLSEALDKALAPAPVGGLVRVAPDQNPESRIFSTRNFACLDFRFSE